MNLADTLKGAIGRLLFQKAPQHLHALNNSWSRPRKRKVILWAIIGCAIVGSAIYYFIHANMIESSAIRLTIEQKEENSKQSRSIDREKDEARRALATPQVNSGVETTRIMAPVGNYSREVLIPQGYKFTFESKGALDIIVLTTNGETHSFHVGADEYLQLKDEIKVAGLRFSSKEVFPQEVLLQFFKETAPHSARAFERQVGEIKKELYIPLGECVEYVFKFQGGEFSSRPQQLVRVKETTVDGREVSYTDGPGGRIVLNDIRPIKIEYCSIDTPAKVVIREWGKDP